MATDKNLGLAIAHIKDYNIFINRHLQDTIHYLQITDNDLNFKTQPFYLQILNKLEELSLNNNLNKNEIHYLKHEFDIKLPSFHVLPKVHKPQVPFLQTRPIIGSIQWITTPASIILDQKLQIILQNFPAILKNSSSLSTHLQNMNNIPENLILVTLDVKSLYTNINLNLLDEILKEFHPIFSNLFNFITDNNYFQYANNIYKQLDGIAMGTNCAVSLANIYLGKLLDPYILQNNHIFFYKRYIDDLFILWNGSLPTLNHFTNQLKLLINGIDFDKPKIHSHNIDFLDLEIFYMKNHFEFRTFQKSINKYQYITPRSCHPPHVFKGFIKGELTRYKRNSSSIKYFVNSKNLFKTRLLLRGYKPSFLDKCFQSVTWSSTNSKPNIIPLPLIFEYNTRHNFPILVQILNKFGVDLKDFLETKKCLISYTKPHSIQQLIIKSRLTATQIDYINSNI
jgi:hypothetical protein